MSNWALILYCGLITYLTRFSMIALIKKEMFNDRIREILSFVPSAIFPAIIFPAIFINDKGLFEIDNNPKILAAIIAISIKIVGLLLITGMLIMPAAMARNVSNNPTQMVKLSIIGGLLSVIIGLFSSLEINTPSGPSIITAALVLFCLTLIKIKNYSELKK